MTNPPSEQPRFDLEVRRMVPVIPPTELVRYTLESSINVAWWLHERGIPVQLHFDGKSAYPAIWRPASGEVKPGTWIGVRDGDLYGTYTDEQLAGWKPADDGEVLR